MTIQTETLDTLVQAFQTHKNNCETRFQNLELKPEQDQVLNFQPYQARSMRLNRGAIASLETKNLDQHEVYQNAFLSYIRKGDTLHLETKTLSSDQDNNGGLLIPKVIDYRLNQQLTSLTSLRQAASVMTITSSAVDLLLNKKGAAVGWVGENEDRKETDSPELTKVTISVHELYAKPRATQRLLDDASINIENWLESEIAHKIADCENKAFLLGDGKKKPKGVLSYETSENYTWGKIQHVLAQEKNKIDIEDLINLQTMLKPEYLPDATWIMLRQTLSIIQKIKTTDGMYIWQPAIAENRPQSILGYPILICDEMPQLQTNINNTPILFGNFKRGYQIVDRQGIYTLRDPYSSEPYVEFYTTKRVGGDVIDFEAIKVLKIAIN